MAGIRNGGNSRFGVLSHANSPLQVTRQGDGRRIAEFASGTLPRPAVKRGRSDFRCFRSQFRSRRQTLPRKFPRPPTLGLLFRLCVRQGPDRALVNRAAVRLGRAASIPRARAHHAHWGRNEKPDLCAAATCTKVRPYLAFAAIPNGCKGRFRSFGRFRFASGLRPGGGNLSVATTSFSWKSSLPPSWWLPSRSSLPSLLSWPCRPL